MRIPHTVCHTPTQPVSTDRSFCVPPTNSVVIRHYRAEHGLCRDLTATVLKEINPSKGYRDRTELLPCFRQVQIPFPFSAIGSTPSISTENLIPPPLSYPDTSYLGGRICTQFASKMVNRVFVYVDGSCISSRHGPVGGYGVYVNHVDYSVSISEPLPSVAQSSQFAEIKGLNSALELVWAMRPRHATIVSDSQYAVNGYNKWMEGWEENGWTRANGEALAHKGNWQLIAEYPSNFRVRKMNVEVCWAPRNSNGDHARADELAKLGCSMNSLCKRCERYVGREGSSHLCYPVCNAGNCDDRRFINYKAYTQHCDMCHSMHRPCRRCNSVFGSEEAALSHEQKVHSSYVFECEYCDYWFQSEDCLDEHQVDDCDDAPYCRSCERWFVSLQSKGQHDRDYHGMYY